MKQPKAVKLPVENFKNLWPGELKGMRTGCLLHPASVDSSLRHTSEIIKTFDGDLFRVKAMFGPQHGYLGHTQDNMVEWAGYEDTEFMIPVYSLYGKHREPTEEMLSGLDCLLVDLQDIGTRYYTFIWTLFLCMKAAEKYGKTIVVCERPNPVNCVQTEGPVLELDYSSFVGMHSIPVRHGKTIGGLAKMFKKDRFPNLNLHVLEMENYKPGMWFDQTGLPWVLPSPNMPTLETALVYPGMCLLEATNVSEGRGTARPFELFGAPFIDAKKMCGYLNNLNLPGVFLREVHFQPTFHKWAGQICNGAQIHVLKRDMFKSFETGIQILKYLYNAYPGRFKWKEPPYEYEFEKMPIDILLGNGWFRKKYIETKE